MASPIITTGATTTHGGIIVECVPNFTIHGKGVHVDGMQHYCPLCKRNVSAIASNHTKNIHGKAIVIEGDQTTCGANFIASQNSAFIDGGAPVSTNNQHRPSPPSNTSDDEIYTTQFQLLDLNKEPQSGIDYLAFFEDGNITGGVTDADGKTEIFQTEKPEEISIHFNTELLSGVEISKIDG